MRPGSSATCCSLPKEKSERERLPTRTNPPVPGVSRPLSGVVGLLPLRGQSHAADAAGGACLFSSAGSATLAPNRKDGECFGRCPGCSEAAPHTAGAHVRDGMLGRLGIARACRVAVYLGTNTLPRRARRGKPPAGGRGRQGGLADRIARETPAVWGIGFDAMEGSLPGGDGCSVCGRGPCGLGPPPVEHLTSQDLRLISVKSILPKGPRLREQAPRNLIPLPGLKEPPDGASMNSGMSSSLMPQLNTRDMTARYLPRVLSLTSRPRKEDFSSFATILIASIVANLVIGKQRRLLPSPGRLDSAN